MRGDMPVRFGWGLVKYLENNLGVTFLSTFNAKAIKEEEEKKLIEKKENYKVVLSDQKNNKKKNIPEKTGKEEHLLTIKQDSNVQPKPIVKPKTLEKKDPKKTREEKKLLAIETASTSTVKPKPLEKNILEKKREDKKLLAIETASTSTVKPKTLEKKDPKKTREEKKLLDIEKASISKENTTIKSNKNKKNIDNLDDLFFECDYKKDLTKKHNVISWKHSKGSLFSKQINFFYDIENVKTIPCASTTEWLNLKQFLFSILNYHVPKIDFVFDFISFSGIKEEFIDNKFEKVALDTVSFYLLLKAKPDLGYFYFKKEDIKKIDSFNISFCNCRVSGYSIIELIFEIIHFQGGDLASFKEHFATYFRHLSETVNQDISSEDMNMSISEFLDLIASNTDIDLFDKEMVFQLIKNLTHIFVPKTFSLHYSVENKNAKPLKNINYPLSNDKNHQTKGFCLKIQNDENNNFYLYLYEIFQNEEENCEKLNYLDQILISSQEKDNYVFFNHLAISIAKKKALLINKIPLIGAIKK